MGKKVKNKRPKRTRRVEVEVTDSIKIEKLHLRYYPERDHYVATLICLLQGKRLSIHGYIHDVALVDEGIQIIGYRNRVNQKHYDRLYNCSELGITVSDAPKLYALVRDYIYYIADGVGDSVNSKSITLDYKPIILESELPAFSEELFN